MKSFKHTICLSHMCIWTKWKDIFSTITAREQLERFRWAAIARKPIYWARKIIKKKKNKSNIKSTDDTEEDTIYTLVCITFISPQMFRCLFGWQSGSRCLVEFTYKKSFAVLLINRNRKFIDLIKNINKIQIEIENYFNKFPQKNWKSKFWIEKLPD